MPLAFTQEDFLVSEFYFTESDPHETMLASILVIKAKDLQCSLIPLNFAAPTYTYQARPSGYRSRFWGGGTPSGQSQTRSQQPNYDRYTGGVSEDEQLARAMRESQQQSKFQCELFRTVDNNQRIIVDKSLWNATGERSGNCQVSTTVSCLIYPLFFLTDGLDDDEQLARAIQESMWQSTAHKPPCKKYLCCTCKPCFVWFFVWRNIDITREIPPNDQCRLVDIVLHDVLKVEIELNEAINYGRLGNFWHFGVGW